MFTFHVGEYLFSAMGLEFREIVWLKSIWGFSYHILTYAWVPPYQHVSSVLCYDMRYHSSHRYSDYMVVARYMLWMRSPYSLHCGLVQGKKKEGFLSVLIGLVIQLIEGRLRCVWGVCNLSTIICWTRLHNIVTLLSVYWKWKGNQSYLPWEMH